MAYDAMQAPVVPEQGFKVLLVARDFDNCMMQRAWLELTKLNLQVHLHFFTDDAAMTREVEKICPNLIFCPFRTKPVPAKMFKSVPCLTVHPGPVSDQRASSVDWAILKDMKEWGVTILQAGEEIGTGAIWSTHNFLIDRSIRPLTKSELYRVQCVNAAMRGTHEVLAMIARHPRPSPVVVKLPRKVQIGRNIMWSMSAAEISRIIRASDSEPGALGSIAGKPYLLFGAHAEGYPYRDNTYAVNRSGSVVGTRDGAILIICGSFGAPALWITHLRVPSIGGNLHIKLRAIDVLPRDVLKGIPDWSVPVPEASLKLTFREWPGTFQEIFMWDRNHVCYLWFDFYNGVMDKDQCDRLATTLKYIKESDKPRVLMLMGGPNLFGNGINLSNVEAAAQREGESASASRTIIERPSQGATSVALDNVIAMGKLVKEVLTTEDSLTVSVMNGNASAGGVMLGLAADEVWTHENVILNPHDKAMGRKGGPGVYWTYPLFKRVGSKQAKDILASTNPMSAPTAAKRGLVDRILPRGASQDKFLQRVIRNAEVLASRPDIQDKIDKKRRRIETDKFQKDIGECREDELKQMQQRLNNFKFDSNRRAFVPSLPTMTDT